MERARRRGAAVLTLEDDSYPALLRASSDPPPILYLRGRLAAEDVRAIAVVGSRRATPHGIDVARRLASGLAAAGFTVVSGLARGIDAAAHRGALEAGGRTLALLGSGLDRIYPVEHLKLAGEIAGRGAVLTEFPFGTPPLRVHFPERNRVLAWVSWATDVVDDAPPELSEAAALLASGRGAAGPGATERGAASPLAGATSGAGPARGVGAARAAGLTPEERGVLEKIPATRGIGIERLGE